MGYTAGEPEFDGESTGPTIQQTIWLGAALIGVGTILNYVQSYMATFGENQLKLSTQASMAAQLSGNLMIIVSAIAGGIACDRWGRKPLLLVPALVLVITMLPMIVWVETSRSTAFFVVNLVLGFVNNVNCPALYAAMAESLPVDRKTRGFALIYSLPVTFLGGSTQLFITRLMKVTGSSFALGYYMTAIGAIGVVSAALLPESAPLILFDRTPGALDAIPFELDVGSAEYATLWPWGAAWCQELEVYHNPLASHPIPFDLMPGATHRFERGGDVECNTIWANSVMWSVTQLRIPKGMDDLGPRGSSGHLADVPPR